jgi:hypothetical protein
MVTKKYNHAEKHKAVWCVLGFSAIEHSILGHMCHSVLKLSIQKHKLLAKYHVTHKLYDL